MRSSAGALALALVVMCCVLAGAAEDSVPATRVALQTSWSESSLFYEIAEFIGELHTERFWAFAEAYGERVGDHAEFTSAQEEYDFVIDVCRDLLYEDKKWLDLLEFAIAARHFNARVNSHASMAAEVAAEAEAAGGSCEGAAMVARLHWAKEYKFDIAKRAEEVTDEEVWESYLEALEATRAADVGPEMDAATLKMKKGTLARQEHLAFRQSQNDTEERFSTSVCGFAAVQQKIEELTEPCVGKPFKSCWMQRTMPQTFPNMPDFSSAHSYGSRMSFIHVELFGDLRSQEVVDELLPELRSFANGRLVHLLFRHMPSQMPYDDEGHVFLQGWGAEMALKSTEYKAIDETEEDSTTAEEDDGEFDEEWVEGVNFATLSKLHPTSTDGLLALRRTLRAQSVQGDLRQLKRWEMTGSQAAYIASHSSNPLKALTDITGNFPSLAPAVASVEVPADYKAVLDAVGTFYRPGASMGFINNRFIPDLSAYTTYDFIETAIEEYRMAQLLRVSGFPDEHALEVLKLPFNDLGRLRFNVSDQIMWLNDLESDSRYQQWPKSLTEMLQPAWPGQLRFVAKNIMNVVVVVDPAEKKALEFCSVLLRLVEGAAPFRFGLMMDTYPNYPKIFAFNQTEIRHVTAVAFQHVADVRGPLDALRFGASLAEYEELTVDDVLGALSTAMDEAFDVEVLLALPANDEVLARNDYLHKTVSGSALPVAFVNGAAYPVKLTMEGMTAVCQDAVQYDYREVQTAVGKRKLRDGDSVFDYFVTGEESLPGYDPLIIDAEPEYVSLASPPAVANIDEYEVASFNSTLISGLRSFLSTDVQWSAELEEFADVSHILVVNLSSNQGVRQVYNMLTRHLEDDVFSEDTRNMRWAVIAVLAPGQFNEDHTDVARTYTDIYNVASSSLPYKKRVLFLRDCFESFHPKEYNSRLDVSARLNERRIGNIRQKTFFGNWADKDYRSNAVEIRRFVMTQLLDMVAGRNYIITNGRITAIPLLGREDVRPFGYRLLEALERKRNAPLVDYITTHFGETHSPGERSDMLMKAASILGKRQTDRFQAPGRLNLREVRTAAQGALLDVRLLLDPLSKEARRMAPLLLAAQEALGDAVAVHLEMNPTADLSELPLSSYYRYAAEGRVQFDERGALSPAAGIVSFDGLPAKPLFTLGIEAAETWMLQQSVAKYDMDNLVLGSLQEDAFALYSLEHLLVQGWCVDLDAPATPPHTLELALTNGAGATVADTVVMQNYGYFQLQAAPGSYRIALPRRSAAVYELARSALRSNDSRPLPHINAAVEDFTAQRTRALVRRRPGMEEAALADMGADSAADERVHVFTVASGHLYERFLKIMILSTTRTSSRPVKFWFLKNYLSPKFVASVAVLAEEYDFEYDFVTYQWPDWLFDQTEKQRKIWAYKILFLDVLFPLDVHRVIFVDADLVVRGDLTELADLDLEGAPYAYTPFCDSRAEMDGFRFWTQGFWADHLKGAPYHISALYVIDLDQFRQTGAGDVIRSVYRSLAPDPNSLANLDQDLPNYMQAQVPIFSLPQEWLWCETWCDDESKASAKAIDLCNNPLTKAPKLDNAVRIVDEWTALDQEVRDTERAHVARLQDAAPPARLAAAFHTAADRSCSGLAARLARFEPEQPQPRQLPTAAESLAGGDIL